MSHSEYKLDLSQPYPKPYLGPIRGDVDIGCGFWLSFWVSFLKDASGYEVQTKANVNLLFRHERIASLSTEGDDAELDDAFHKLASELLSDNWNEMQRLAGPVPA